MAWAGISAISYDVKVGGTVVGDVHRFEDTQRFKSAPVQLSTQHGGVMILHRKGLNGIRVAGQIYKASLEAMRDHLVTLDNLFTVGDQDVLITTPDDRIKTARVLSRRFERIMPEFRVPYELELEVLEPFWLHPETYDVTTSAGTSPWLFTINNEGKEKVRIIVEITAVGGNRGNMRLINTTTGNLWNYNGTITQNKKLMVDGVALEVKANNIVGLNDFEHAPFELASGNNQLRYEGDVPVDIKVTWRPRYGG